MGLAAHHCSRFSAFFISGADALFLFLSNQPPADPATIYLIASAAVLVLFDPPTSFSKWSLLRLWYPNSARLQPNRSQIDAALVTVSTRETRRGRFLKVLEVTIRKRESPSKGLETVAALQYGSLIGCGFLCSWSARTRRYPGLAGLQ